MQPKYYKDFKAVLAHLRHKEQEYIPIKSEKKAKKKTAKKKKETDK